MDEISVTPVTELPSQLSQPTPVVLDDNAVREAIARAEQSGVNPETLSIADLSKESVTASVPQTVEKVEVPEKFLKPDGAVDVEKIQASTRQLDEAIAKKDEALKEVTKTIEDYVRDYQEREKKFRAMPNPEKLAASLPPPPAPSVRDQIVQGEPSNMTREQLEALINRDLQTNPAATMWDLIQIALDKQLEPVRQKEKVESVRSNIQKLAETDPRVLRPEVYQAIQDELGNHPELWSTKNPHRAAWLEVKERMQLGDLKKVDAPTSKIPSPTLGAGVPPPPTSVTSQKANPQDVLRSVDLRDPKQEAIGDQMIRELLKKSDRW